MATIRSARERLRSINRPVVLNSLNNTKDSMIAIEPSMESRHVIPTAVLRAITNAIFWVGSSWSESSSIDTLYLGRGNMVAVDLV